jgi:hypothetical protein
MDEGGASSGMKLQQALRRRAFPPLRQILELAAPFS